MESNPDSEAKGNSETISVKVCLICHSSSNHFKDFARCLNGSKPASLLSKDISVYFILKHVLDLPSRRLESYFKTCSSPPNEWVKICAECGGSYVDRCAEIFVELVKVKKRFDKARRKLIETIKSSVPKEGAGTDGGGDWRNMKGPVLDACEETRRFVKHHDYGKCGVNPFATGDMVVPGKILTFGNCPASEDIILDNRDTFILPTSPDDNLEDDDGDVKKEPASPSAKENETGGNFPDTFHDERGDDGVSWDGGDDDNQSEVSEWDGHDESKSESSADEETSEEGRNEVTPTSALKRRRKRRKLRRSKPQSQMFRCDQCFKMCLTASSLQSHQIIIHKTNLYKCPECDWKTASKPSLRDHIARLHTTSADLQEFTCPTCNKIFSSRSSLKSHTAAQHKRKKILTAPIICEYCQRELTNTDVYRSHLARQHNVQKWQRFPCTFEGCGKGFFKRGQLECHQEIHTDPQYECHVCGQSFRLRSNHKRHMKQHEDQRKTTTSKPYQCPVCPAAFTRSDNLLGHLKNVHKPDFKKVDSSKRAPIKRTDFKCLECGVVFGLRKGLQHHIRKMHGEKEFEEQPCQNDSQEKLTCQQCGKDYYSQPGFQNHLVTKHGLVKGEPRFRCSFDGCEKSFYVQNSFLAHQRAHGVSGYKCDICAKSFSLPKSLEKHKNRFHQNDEGPYTISCDMCALKFKQNVNLKLHKKNCHKISGLTRPREKRWLNLPCGQCEKKFSSQRMLRSHVKLKHHRVTLKKDKVKPKPVEGVYSCSSCGNTYKSQYILTQHIKVVHERRYEACCELCGIKVSSYHYMKRHLRRMHNVGDFEFPSHPCTVEGCDKSFENKGRLEEHVLIVHEGQRPFVCDLCGKGFPRSKHLRNHIQAMHTNRESKPFKCDECGKGFAIKDYLWLHKKTHQPKKGKVKEEPSFLQL